MLQSAMLLIPSTLETTASEFAGRALENNKGFNTDAIRDYFNAKFNASRLAAIPKPPKKLTYAQQQLRGHGAGNHVTGMPSAFANYVKTYRGLPLNTSYDSREATTFRFDTFALSMGWITRDPLSPKLRIKLPVQEGQLKQLTTYDITGQSQIIDRILAAAITPYIDIITPTEKGHTLRLERLAKLPDTFTGDDVLALGCNKPYFIAKVIADGYVIRLASPTALKSYRKTEKYFEKIA